MVVLTWVRVFLTAVKPDTKIVETFLFFLFTIIGVIVIIVIVVQIHAQFEILDLTDSVERQGHFALYNCLVLGHTKHNAVQRVYCNPFLAKLILQQPLTGPLYDAASRY